MEDYEKAVEKFIHQRGYLLDQDVLGIVLYGSFITGYNNEKSDIDMHIIMSNNVKRLIRGSQMHNGYKIEYFEKPISDLYESADNDFLTHSNALLPIIGHGKILFDKTGEVAELQKYILSKYSSDLPSLSENDAREMVVIIENRIKQLEIMYDTDRIDFNHNYHLLIEKIRKFYSRLCGCADIPVAKAYKIYTNKSYRDAFCKSTIPDQEFIKIYFEAITCDGSNKEKIDYIWTLFNYAIKSLNINPNDYRIVIKSRNDPMNRIHE